MNKFKVKIKTLYQKWF